LLGKKGGEGIAGKMGVVDEEKGGFATRNIGVQCVLEKNLKTQGKGCKHGNSGKGEGKKPGSIKDGGGEKLGHLNLGGKHSGGVYQQPRKERK